MAKKPRSAAQRALARQSRAHRDGRTAAAKPIELPPTLDALTRQVEARAVAAPCGSCNGIGATATGEPATGEKGAVPKGTARAGPGCKDRPPPAARAPGESDPPEGTESPEPTETPEAPETPEALEALLAATQSRDRRALIGRLYRAFAAQVDTLEARLKELMAEAGTAGLADIDRTAKALASLARTLTLLLDLKTGAEAAERAARQTARESAESKPARGERGDDATASDPDALRQALAERLGRLCAPEPAGDGPRQPEP